MLKRVCKGIVVVVIACASSFTSAQHHWRDAHYVNMGSSFAAGLGIEPSVANMKGRCGRSAANYASLLAESLHLQLTDVSCSGAKTQHLLQPWIESSLPAQIDALKDNTQLVTVTVGGNDVDYVSNLFANSCSDAGKLSIAGTELPCLERTLVDESRYQQLAHNYAELLTAIASRSPQAKIVVIQYLRLLPDTLCKSTPLADDEAHRIRKISERLARITSAAAAKAGAMVVPTDQLSAGHTACDAEPWSIGAVQTDSNSEGLLWHPNRRGHEVIAAEILKMLGS